MKLNICHFFTCLFLGLIVFSKSVIAQKRILPYINIRNYADSIISKKNTSDTILMFYNDCYCCVEGTEKVLYVFTKNKSETIVSKISNYGIHNNKNGYINWNKIFKSLEKLNSEKIHNYQYAYTDSLGREVSSKYITGQFYRIKLITSKDSIEKVVMKTYLSENSTTFTYELINEIKSYLFDLEFYLIQKKIKKKYGRPKIITNKF